MNQMNLSQTWRLRTNPFNPSEQFVPVAVCAIPIQDFNLRAQRNLFAKHPDGGSFFDDPSAECVFGLKAYYKNGVARIVCAVREVVNNST